jgi:hypothetical protein
MIVVEVGVKTECKIDGCRSIQKNIKMMRISDNLIFLKLIAKQLNISK